MTKTIATFCASLFLLTACGGGGEDTAKESIKDELLSSDTDLAGTKLTDEEAGCVSDGMVEDLGTEKLQDVGLLNEDNEVIKDAKPEDLSAEDADALAGTIVDCVDVQELMSEQMGAAMDQMTDEQTDCIKGAFDEDTIQDLISSGFQGEEPQLGGDLQEKVMGCVGGVG